jgi:phosphoenolpyruvate-protein phosphotransferase (PTS system enzyme I)
VSLALSGIGVSRGIAIGKAYLLQRGLPEVSEYAIPKAQIKDEVTRFMQAVVAARQQLKAIRKQIPADTSQDIASFIDTHLLMLKDSALSEVPINLIRSRKCNAEWALKLQRDALVNVFEQMDDPYLRTRKDDVDHVVNRIQRILLKQEGHSQDTDVMPLKGRIIVADDLTPADAILMQHQGIAGFVTEHGGPLSHTAIIARNLRIPAIVGVRHARRYLNDDEELILDGRQGVVLAEADDATILHHYRRLQSEERRYRTQLAKLKGEPAITRDGRVISLQANIELPEDVHAARRVAAAGVGLYRTESLFMNRDAPPDEEEQLAVYLQVLHGMRGAPVTIRTLDLGADKQVNDGRDERPVSTNPALGLRAIRLCLKDLTLFRPQLRAILRASAQGPLRMMVPMLSNLQEIQQVLQLIDESKQELTRQGLKFDPELPVGGMIEVPAAAISAQFFAPHLDFMSIGTNDLIQYTLAIDRVEDDVNYLYDPLHPAVLHLIRHVIEAGHNAGVPVAMCGEMAGDIRYTRLLLGLGLREFSMQPATLLEVKNIINTSHADELAAQVLDISRYGHADDINRLVTALNRE